MRGPPKRLGGGESGGIGGRGGLQAIKEVVGVDLDALCVDVGELGLPPVHEDGAVCVVWGAGGGEEVRGGVRGGADVVVEFGADGEGGVRHGAARGWAGYDGVDGYAFRTEGKAVQRPREGCVRPGVVFKDKGDVGGVGKVGHQQAGRVVSTRGGTGRDTHASWRTLLRPCPQRWPGNRR